MNSNNTFYYNIAELYIKIAFENGETNSIALLKSLHNFKTEDFKQELFFTFYVKEEKDIKAENSYKLLTSNNNGNGDVEYYISTNGNYKIIVKDVENKNCAYLYTTKDYTAFQCVITGNYASKCYGLNNCLIMAFSLTGAFHNTLLMHASVVRHNEKAYAFIAKSGTGKSTQVSSWLRYIPNCDLINDDCPIIRIINNEVWLYGSPWSGKTTCYRNIKVKLGGVVRIMRSEHNSIEQKPLIASVASILPSISTMKWDDYFYTEAHKMAFQILATVPHYFLHCLPNKEAALLCHKKIIPLKTHA